MIKCKRIILSLLLRTKAACQMDLQTLWYLIHVVATHSQAGLRDLARKVALKGQTRSWMDLLWCWLVEQTLLAHLKALQIVPTFAQHKFYTDHNCRWNSWICYCQEEQSMIGCCRTGCHTETEWKNGIILILFYIRYLPNLRSSFRPLSQSLRAVGTVERVQMWHCIHKAPVPLNALFPVSSIVPFGLTDLVQTQIALCVDTAWRRILCLLVQECLAHAEHEDDSYDDDDAGQGEIPVAPSTATDEEESASSSAATADATSNYRQGGNQMCILYIHVWNWRYIRF